MKHEQEQAERSSDARARSTRPDKKSLLTLAVLLAGIIGAVLVGSTVVDGLSDQLDQADVASLDTIPTSSAPGVTGAIAADAAGETPSEPDPVSVPSTTPVPAVNEADEIDDQSATEVTVADGPPAASIQLVPAERDVLVEVDGERLASDSSGLIDVSGFDPDAEITFVGIEATPSLRQVSLGTWADGNPSSARRLGDLVGPIAPLGIIVELRVTVSTQTPVDDESTITFTSDAGAIVLRPGRTAFVPAARGVIRDGEIALEELDYSIASVTIGGEQQEVEPQTFAATPEALWVVET